MKIYIFLIINSFEFVQIRVYLFVIDKHIFKIEKELIPQRNDIRPDNLSAPNVSENYFSARKRLKFAIFQSENDRSISGRVKIACFSRHKVRVSVQSSSPLAPRFRINYKFGHMGEQKSARVTIRYLRLAHTLYL